MESAVSVNAKREFLQWFLKKYKLKRREGVWILNYIMTKDHLMQNVHFVEQVQYTPKGLLMTTECVDEIPFCFYKHHIRTTDAEKSFHDIRLNQHEEIYIELQFKSPQLVPKYMAVLEENPFVPQHLQVKESDRMEAEYVVKQSLYRYEVKKLKKQIDLALDEYNYETFIKLTKRLNEITASL